MDQEKLTDILRDNLRDGKLPCAKAFKISKEYKISLKLIGKAANEAKIKISNCQLGCFK